MRDPEGDGPEDDAAGDDASVDADAPVNGTAFVDSDANQLPGTPSARSGVATLEIPERPKATPSLLPPVMQSVRFRLTLLYSVMLFGVASIVVGGIYWGLSRSLNEQVTAELARQDTIAFDLEQDRYEDRIEFEILVDQQTLATLRQYSFVGLAALFIMSFGVGWYTAGRVLMPIGRITRVAKDIQATDLSRRIGLLGPNDDLKQLADTFDSMLDRLQQAFNNQQRLIHDTSHELRNPLAVMRTNLDVTLSDPQADLDQYQKTSEIVHRSSERMSKLVDDLLAYARHEAATRTETPVDLSALVTNIVDEFESPADSANLSINTDVQPGLSVMAHARSIEQAVANLLANAVRFAPETTTITVTAGADSGWIWITVSDLGPGIPVDERDRVFNRYVRLGDGEADRPHLAGGQGSGLGLAIVREIVQSHRGEVSILDTPVGTTIAIWLPQRDEDRASAEPRRRPRRKALLGITRNRSDQHLDVHADERIAARQDEIDEDDAVAPDGEVMDRDGLEGVEDTDHFDTESDVSHPSIR